MWTRLLLLTTNTRLDLDCMTCIDMTNSQRTKTGNYVSSVFTPPISQVGLCFRPFFEFLVISNSWSCKMNHSDLYVRILIYHICPHVMWQSSSSLWNKFEISYGLWVLNCKWDVFSNLQYTYAYKIHTW